jgi:hypothetical protein
MIQILINPGSGPVAGATEDDAKIAIQRFVEDLDLDGCKWEPTTRGASEGRYTFLLTRHDLKCVVEMPGVPIDRVRYLGDGQDIWQFPWLYVDGSSLAWCFGIEVARESLSPEHDEATE